MKTLLILRHAKSSWKDPSLADHDRPLNKRGKRDAPRMGDLIRAEGLVPDLILSSTAKRARDTAREVADSCGYEGEVQQLRELYHGDPQDYVQALQAMPAERERVMVIGHNPGLEALLEDLIGGYERLPTAALAEVHLPIDAWDQLTGFTEGRLANLWHPRLLP